MVGCFGSNRTKMMPTIRPPNRPIIASLDKFTIDASYQTAQVCCTASDRCSELLRQMPKCLFCPTEQDILTEEHVFPAALGGVLVVENSVCAECNNGFSKFEQPLIMELAPLRLIFKIPDRYGRIPYADATVTTATSEYDARVMGDGRLQMKRIVTEIVTQDGKREFLHQFLTDRQRERLERESKEKGYQLIQEGPGKPEEGEVHLGGNLKEIGTPDGLRAVAKIAFMGLAFRAGANLARSGAFDEIRAYISTGSGTSPVRLFVHQRFMNAVQQGPHQHSIIIAARHDRRRVDAIVTLFGGICYFVEMSNRYDGADFFATLVYNAQLGEVDGVLQSHFQAEMLQTEDVLNSSETVWADLVESGKVFVRYLEKVIEAKRMRDRGAVR